MVNITASLHPIFFANFAPKKTLVSASSWFEESSIWQAHETVIAVIDHVSASFYRYKHYLLLQSCKRNSRSSSLFEPREVLLLLLWKLLLRSHSCDSYGSTSALLGVLIRLNWRFAAAMNKIRAVLLDIIRNDQHLWVTGGWYTCCHTLLLHQLVFDWPD